MDEQMKRLDACMLALPGAESDFKAEWGWQRYLVGGKMFAAFCRPGETHAAEYAGHPLLTVKTDPAEGEFLRGQYPDILPGFYMDKRCWLSLRLDGALEEELLTQLAVTSYRLVFGKLTKKLQRALTEASEAD